MGVAIGAGVAGARAGARRILFDKHGTSQQRFEKLRNHLRAFDDPALGAEDYETAAEMHNRCRSRGVAGSAIDFLLCAVAELRQWQIFTTDRDFERYRRVLAVKLYVV
jgi:predicted nucleic acid-binding protein